MLTSDLNLAFIKETKCESKKSNITTDRASPQSQLNILQIGNRDPAFCNQTILYHIQVEHVERVVDALYLPHFHHPCTNVSGSRDQHTVTVILGLTQHLVEKKMCFKF